MTSPPADQVQYIEAPNVAYEEMTTRVGEVIQAAFRDASLVGNMDGAKKRDDAGARHRREDPEGQRQLLRLDWARSSDGVAPVVAACQWRLRRAPVSSEIPSTCDHQRDHLLWVVIALGPVFALFCIIRVYPILETIRLSFYRYHPTQRNRAVHRPRQLLAAARRRGVPHRADQHAAVLRDGGGHHAAARLRHRGAAALDREGRAGLRAAALYPGGDAVGAGLGDLEMDFRSDPRDPELRAVVPRYAEARLAAGRARHHLRDRARLGVEDARLFRRRVRRRPAQHSGRTAGSRRARRRDAMAAADLRRDPDDEADHPVHGHHRHHHLLQRVRAGLCAHRLGAGRAGL